MFDIGWGELVVIGIVALIAIGPKELPTVLRTLGQYMAKIRRMAADFQGQFQEAMREAEMADLKKQAEDLKSSVTDLTRLRSAISPISIRWRARRRKLSAHSKCRRAQKAGEASAEGAATTPPALPEPQQQVEVNVPLPESPSPVS